MNSISIDNQKYVKATDIARELGYTADYVGQLCRAEKVDSQLVGRSWYVSEDSLRAHKKTRYRSTKTVSKKTIATSLEAEDLDTQESFSVAMTINKSAATSSYAKQAFYSRSPVKNAPSYSNDDSDLLPTNTKVKTGKLSVSLGDAKTVKIKSSSKEFDFNPTARPEISFSGSLSVQDVYDEDEILEDEKVVEKKPVTLKSSITSEKSPAKATVAPAVLATKIKVKHLRKDTKLTNKKLPIEHNDDGIIGMRRDRITDRNPVGGTLKIAVPSDNPSVSQSGVYIIAVSTVVSVVVSFVIVGLQADITTQGSTLATSYTFEFTKLVAAISAAWQ